MSWQTKPLRDCVTFSSGGTPSKANPDYWNGDIPWVSSGELTSQFINDTSLHISSAGAQAGSRLVPEGTIFAVVRGMSLATEFRVAIAMRELAFNQDLKALSVKDGVDPYFLFSSLRAHSKQIRDLATEAAHGTKKLEMERLESFPIPLPPLDIQREAARVVKNYDSLIEANHRRIALLEESARLLYREWFVNLRFPGHGTIEIRNRVPTGWHYREISSQVSLLSRGIAPRYDDSAKGLVVNQKCIRDGRLSLKQARRQSKEVKPERLLQIGDILINSTGAGTLGRVAQVRCKLGNCTLDTHVTVLRPLEQKSISFLGVALLELEPVFSRMGVGSTNQLELSRAEIGAMKILIPTEDLREAFHHKAWPIFEQVESLARMNEVLTTSRNALLPKLMSGALPL